MPWPYLSSQCPSCRYFAELDTPTQDDAGYQVPGACTHPRIGMELFVPRRAELAELRCDLRRPGTPREL
jgi:hypothetical protein